MTNLTLRVGRSGLEVRRLQELLNSVGIPTPITGTYTHETGRAVLDFQRVAGLNPTGEADASSQQILIEKSRVRRPVQQVVRSVVRSSTLTLVIVYSDEPRECLDRCLNSILVAGRNQWKVVLATRSRLNLSGNIDQVEYSGHWVFGLNRGIDHAKRSANGDRILMPIRAGDVVSNGLANVLAIMSANNYPCVHGDFESGGQVIRAKTESPVMETVRVGSILFRESVIRQSFATFPDFVGNNAVAATLLSWYFSGVKIVPVTGWVMATLGQYPSLTADHAWCDLRRQIYARKFQPKVSALMVTGRSSGRLPFARMAVKSFLRQTWSNKELVIINHGNSKVWTGVDSRIRESMVNKSPGVTLGDLRNRSIDTASGDWCIQWDDDDWYSDTRIENQMANRLDGHVTTLKWQIRCAMTDGSAFYDLMPLGQQMTVLFERSTRNRYKSIECKEDTAFMALFGTKVVCMDNGLANVSCDPSQYIRFFHGMNICDYTHVMHGWR